MDSSIVTLIIVGVMMILFMTELLPAAATSILVCLALAVFGVVPIDAAFQGFGNDMVYLIVGMVVVGSALFETGVAQLMGKRIISAVGTDERVFAITLTAVITVVSLFISNTATVAIMLPIAASAIGASGGKLQKKYTYMMVGIVTVVTGGLTLIGSTPQLIAQDFLYKGGHETMSFFEISKVGLPLLALTTIYFQTIGRKLQQKVFDFEEPGHSVSSTPSGGCGAEQDAAKGVTKMILAVAILVFCIVGFVSGLWSMGTVAMAGAVLCVAVRCISQKKVFEQMDWTTVVIMGCSFGIGSALDQSGAGRLVAHGVVNLLGDDVTPWLLCAALAFVAMLLTNFMSSTATATLLVPIAGLVAVELGYDVKSVVMVAAISTNLGYTTPISTPPITMTLSGGYRFMDYVKVGGLFNLLTYFFIVMLFPVVFNF